MIKLKLSSLLIALMGICIATSAIGQTWEIGYQTMTFVDGSRSNRQIETELFYPTDVSGFNVPLGSPLDKRYPVIVFGHDQGISWNNYAFLWNRFASQGFIVAVPKTEMGAAMDVVEFAKDMAFIASQFNVMRYTPGSFFYDRHNSKSCVMGHGTGGSAATFAVQYYPSVTTMVSLAATETVPSAISAASLVTVPSVVVGGDEDCISPIATNQMPMFNNIDSDCKTFVNLLDATHCHFAQDAGFCTGSIVCPNSGNSWQNTCRNTNYLIISFLRYYMKSNAPALAKFEWKLQSKANDWSYIFSCSQLAPRLTAENNEMDQTTSLGLYPNPVHAGTSINMVVASEESTNATLMIADLMGQVVTTEEIALDESENTITIKTDQLKKGYYMVSVISTEGRISKPLIIQ